MKTTEQIIAEATEKANALIAKGNTNSFEKLLAIYIKSLTPKEIKPMTKKDVEKMERQERVATFVKSGEKIDSYEIYRKASLNQRGSSMRK
jgi:hypothetical protein